VVLAALLHDIGHLIEPAPDDIGEWKSDAQHELTGSRWLARHFGPEVYEPVRLHVLQTLPLRNRGLLHQGVEPASIITLKLQGGPCRRPKSQPSSPNPTGVRHWWYVAVTTRANYRDSERLISTTTAR